MACLNSLKHQLGENLVWPTTKDSDILVEANHYFLRQILHDEQIFILSTAAICMEVKVGISEVVSPGNGEAC